MGIRAKLTTKGFEEYLERIDRAGASVDAIAAKALAAGGKVLVDGMQSRVPEDTGNLKSKISMSDPRQDGNFVYIEVGLVEADAETARYGNVQEFGSAKTPAQPYIRPTMDRDMGKARKAMRAVFDEEAAKL